MADTILVEDAGGPIATVVLNRPEKLNALTRPMWKRLGEAFEDLSASESVRCIVIRGAGTKAFAPGNDWTTGEDVCAGPGAGAGAAVGRGAGAGAGAGWSKTGGSSDSGLARASDEVSASAAPASQ